MSHVVLLGDAIFDNATCVKQGDAVIDVLHEALPANWKATLLARVGSVALDVGRQLASVPVDATHLVISCGASDVVDQIVGPRQMANATSDASQHARMVLSDFEADYCWMIHQALGKNKRLAIGTMYGGVPVLETQTSAVLASCNDIIRRCATAHRLPLLDFHKVLNEVGDWCSIASPLSIVPSMRGSKKIGAALARLLHT